MDTDLTQADAGKPVVDANGDSLGTITRVEDGCAFVDPNDDIPSLAAVVLRWGTDGDSYPLSNRHVESVTAEGVHLKSNL